MTSSSSIGLSVGSSDDFIVLDKFAVRQFQLLNNFNASSSSQQHISTSASLQYNPIEFTGKINEYYKQHPHLIDGYASFCKHIFIPNFIGSHLRCAYATITDDNRRYLKSDYITRSNAEVPVLSRWMDKEYVQGNEATHLDIILYSRQQIYDENYAMEKHSKAAASSGSSSTSNSSDNELEDAMESIGSHDVYENGNWEWGIISIKPQEGDKELPMLPITIMRNSLGKDEGGSGVKINRDEYMKSIGFWKQHANAS